MARIRSIKPGFAGDSKVARLSLSARLTFILLLCEADDDGRMVASPKRLAGLLYPNDDNIGPKQVERWVGELEVEGMVSLYEVDGTRYLHIVKFGKHQNPQHPTPSTLPPPPGSRKSSEPITKLSGPVHEALIPELSVVDLGVEKESSPSDRERNSRIEGACAAIAERRLERNGKPVKSPKAWLETTRRSLLAEVMAYFDRHPDASVNQAVVALDEGELPAEPVAEVRPPSVQPFGTTTKPIYDLDENGNAIRVAR